jgi:hypothetical protein
LKKRSAAAVTKRVLKPETKQTQVERSSQIREAVARSVREYGEALKKLAEYD